MQDESKMPCLTDQFLYRVKQPQKAQDRFIIRDSLLAGFAVVVSSKSISYTFTKQINQKRKHIVIGKFPFESCEQARIKAFDLLQGKPLVTVTQPTPPAGKTAKQLFTDYANSRKLAASTVTDLVERCPRLLGDYANKPASELDQVAFEAIYRQLIADNRASSARLLARYVSAVWNWESLPNPTTNLARRTGMAPTKSNAKEARLEKHQISKFNTALNKLTPETKTGVLVALFTGMRRSELQSLTKSNLCHDTKSIKLKTTKSKKPHLLPVGDVTWSLLSNLNRLANQPLLTIPDRIPKAIHDLGLSWHDLRRSCGSLLSELGADLAVVKRILNHTTGNDITLKHYLHISNETIRKWLNELEWLILGIQLTTPEYTTTLPHS
jgi:integrase